jgi:hypothetical protein
MYAAITDSVTNWTVGTFGEGLGVFVVGVTGSPRR